MIQMQFRFDLLRTVTYTKQNFSSFSNGRNTSRVTGLPRMKNCAAFPTFRFNLPLYGMSSMDRIARQGFDEKIITLVLVTCFYGLKTHQAR
jgi:hypothetical protein